MGKVTGTFGGIKISICHEIRKLIELSLLLKKVVLYNKFHVGIEFSLF